MSSRTNLQHDLEQLLSSENVYFQPPSTVQMKYPAIVYTLNSIDTIRANNSGYKSTKSYSVTLIDQNPDSEFVDKLVAFPMCKFDRHFKSDKLNHYIFTLYY